MPGSSLQQSYDLALQHHRAGRLREAESLYRQILTSDPNHADALHMLGGIAHAAGHHAQAIELFRKAIALNPNFPDYHGNLAIILASTGQSDAAIASLRTALSLRTDYPPALYNLAKLLVQQGQFDEAIAAYRNAVQVQPNFPEAHNNLGDLLRQRGLVDKAIGALRTALLQRPNFPEALFNLGLCQEAQDEFEAALATFTDLLKLVPNSPEAHNELGNVLRELNRPREALAAHQRAIAFRPNFVQARWQAALCHLSLGEFEQGWCLFESRRQLPEWSEPRFDKPQWNGSNPTGKRLLLWSEQGLGDTIQFIRYAPLLTARGAQVHLRCQPPLLRLLSKQLTLKTVTPENAPLPPFDLHYPLLSLPHLFRTTLDSIPAETPYLKPDPELASAWANRLKISGALRRVGIAWATNLLPDSARKRWINPAALSQLASVRDVQFISLQKTPPGSAPVSPPPGLPLVDYTADLNDFAETAALLANLDLVITCDTSVAHLAGAMGKSTWIALPFAAPWRWMIDRTDSPWYPTARLFRQPRPGDWTTPIRQMAEELSARLHSGIR
jgi:tetratricopeptide (TPR) repeat protein